MLWLCFTYLFDVRLCSGLVVHVWLMYDCVLALFYIFVWCTTVFWFCFTYLFDVRLWSSFVLHIFLMYDCVVALFYIFVWCTTVFWLCFTYFVDVRLCFDLPAINTHNLYDIDILKKISQCKVIQSRWKCKKIPELSTMMFLYEMFWRNHTANQVSRLCQFQCLTLETWHACTFGMQVLKYI